MDSNRKDEIIDITEDLVEFETYHQGFGGFYDKSQVDDCLNYIADYFDDTDLVIKKYGHEDEEFTGEAFVDNPNPVYENPKPSMIISNENTEEPKYLLHGHVDVVQPQQDNYIAEKREISDDEQAKKDAHFNPLTEGDKIYGRGTADMKLNVATMMSLMKDIDESDPSTALMITTDEELGGFRGAGYLFQDVGYDPEFTISAEPTVSDEGFSITYRQKGNFQLEVSAEGEAGHGSRPWEGENANDNIVDWFDVYSELKNRFPDYEEDRWVSTMNLGILEGGTKRTSIADKSSVELGIRFTDDYRPLNVMQDIAGIENVEIQGESAEEIVEEINEANDEYQYRVLNNEPMQMNQKDDENIQRLQRVAEEVTGEDVELKKWHGASDARWPTIDGNPAVTFGARGKNLHGENEFADLSSIDNFYDSLKRFILEE